MIQTDLRNKTSLILMKSKCSKELPEGKLKQGTCKKRAPSSGGGTAMKKLRRVTLGNTKTDGPTEA